MARSAVLGCGVYLPPEVMTTEALAAPLETSAADLVARTGVRRRHRAPDGVAPSDLARDASAAALAAAGLGAEDIDLIVFATMTPDIPFPGSGCFLQHKLGCRTVGALDVRAQCAGFVFALATADRFIRSGKAERVLVAGAEVHTTALEYAPRAAHVTPYFGDGAGAIVLGASDQAGILATVLGSDPDGFERFWCEFPASRHMPARMDMEHFRAGDHYYHLDAERLHPQAERVLVGVTRDALVRAGVEADDVALFLVHYLDGRVARRVAEQALGLPAERVVATADAAGHVAAAGLPIALTDALASGRVRRGDLVCLTAFGAGMSWASAVLRL
jgi:3-oxoacyl-[acyl-carrier-protein] synthase III